MNRQTFRPKGLRQMAPDIYCACCLETIHDHLNDIPGISSMRIDHSVPHVTVEYDPSEVNLEKMNEVLSQVDTCSPEAGPYELRKENQL